MISWFKKNPLSSCVLLFLVFYIVLIGDPDAPRQSTEGFYLKIAKEMWERGSLITPYYEGERHWSKPPFMFWLPMPIYATNIFDILTASRLAVLLYTLGLLTVLSRWVKIHLKISPVLSFVFFASSFGVMRYSRIFMMEMPLALFSTLSAAFVYNYIQDRTRQNFFLSVLFLALSVLVKGPISWVMVGLGLGLYLCYRAYKKLYIPWYGLLGMGLLSVGLGGLWFLVCYIQYGQEFFDFFFMKNNFGKFKAQEYPISVLFQGLLLFSLPWSLFLLAGINKIKLLKEKSSWIRTLNQDPIVFIALNFFSFFLLWFIPSQRSHHYAFPSTFFFLILILWVIKDVDIRSYRFQATKLLFLIPFGFFAAISTFVSLIFFQGQPSAISASLISLALFFLMFYFFVAKPKNLLSMSLMTGLCWSIIYCFTIVVLARPILPQRIIDLIGNRSVSVVTMKPFFISEQLQRPIDENLRHGPDLKAQLEKVDDLYLIYKSIYEHQGLDHGDGQIIERWSVWKRGVDLNDLLEAFRSQKYFLLEDEIFLIQRQ